MVGEKFLWLKSVRIWQVKVAKSTLSLFSLPKFEDRHDHRPEGHRQKPQLKWTSSPKLRSNQPPVSAGARPPRVKDLPSSSRGRRASSRASLQRRESKGGWLFSLLQPLTPMKWGYVTVLSPRSFGDDIPGMEGLGTGEVTLLASAGSAIKGLEHRIYFRFLCFRYHRHLPLGGLQSPGAARAGSVRHHLSLSRTPPAILLGF